MKKFNGKLLLILLTILLVLVFSLPTLAVTPVDPSDTLEVYIRTGSGSSSDVLLHTYTLSEMEAMATEDVYYSDIDNMPCPVLTIATGVYLEDLLNDIQDKYMTGDYATLDVWDFIKLRFVCTDTATGFFDYDFLFDTDRYYFPLLHELGLNEDNEIDYDIGAGELVAPMLSISATQGRRPMPVDEYREDYEPESYTILFGMSDDDVENATARLSSCKRGICTMIIDMGSGSSSHEKIEVVGIRLDQDEASILPGQMINLLATVYPENATNKGVSWESSNPNIASVSQSGLVTGLAVGTTEITVTADDNQINDFSYSCTITVAQSSSPVSSVLLSKTALTMTVGAEKKLIATVLPSDAQDRTVSWKSSNTNVATVDNKGLITAKASGEAKITATAGGISSVCTVTVYSIDSNELAAVSGVTLNRTSLTMAKGAVYQLEAAITPKNAANDSVYWSTDAPGVVSVDTNGLITAKNIGSAVISATTDDGNYTAQCTVTVSDSVDSFSDINDSWAKDNIEGMVKLGLISGYSDGTFRPSASITRAEYVCMLMRVLAKTSDVKLTGSVTFSDTKSHWANDYIAAAAEQGIVTGYNNGDYGPDDNITREQIAVMLAKANGYDPNQPTPGFTDTSLISTWALSAVSYTAAQGWLSGYNDNSFGPQNYATRAEVCTALLRFYQNCLETQQTETSE